MRHSKIWLTGILLGSLSVAQAESPFSANVALTSDYMFRGVSQTNEEPAIQGGFDFNHESGLYVGTWASNVNFGSLSDASSEHDVYIGFSKDAENGVGFDVGIVRYIYPGDSVLDYNEYYGSLSFRMDKVTLTGSIYYSNDVFGTDETGIYYQGSAEVGITDQIKLNASMGKYDFDRNVFGPGMVDSYLDWKLGVAAEVEGWGFDLSYVDTNSDGEKLFGDLASGRVVFTVSKSL